MPACAGMTVRCWGDFAYFTAEKRLSNELVGTIGAEPATRLSFAAGGAAAAGASAATVGFSGGCAAACLISGFDAFGAEAAAWAAGSLRLASVTFGFAGVGCAVAVVSAAPSPTLRARLLKKSSDCAFGAADATR